MDNLGVCLIISILLVLSLIVSIHSKNAHNIALEDLVKKMDRLEKYVKIYRRYTKKYRNEVRDLKSATEKNQNRGIENSDAINNVRKASYNTRDEIILDQKVKLNKYGIIAERKLNLTETRINATIAKNQAYMSVTTSELYKDFEQIQENLNNRDLVVDNKITKLEKNSDACQNMQVELESSLTVIHDSIEDQNTQIQDIDNSISLINIRLESLSQKEKALEDTQMNLTATIVSLSENEQAFEQAQIKLESKVGLAQTTNKDQNVQIRLLRLQLNPKLHYSGSPACYPESDYAWQYVTSDSGSVWFFVPTIKKNWDDASNHCKTLEKNARFGRILNGIEKNTLAEFGALWKSESRVWIGGFANSERQWYWEDMSPVKYFNWIPGEPNNYGGVEDVLELYNHINLGDIRWNDNTRSYKQCFLCEVRCL